MAPTDNPIPIDWLSHEFCPRDGTQSLRLRQNDGKVAIELTAAHWYLAVICLLSAIGLFAFWWLFLRYDESAAETKWGVLFFGCIFTLIMCGCAMTNYRYSKYGQSLTVDTEDGVVTLTSRNGEERISLATLKGLQILSKPGHAQLILVYEVGNRIERRWIHTDSPWHIDALAESFQDSCGFSVISRFDYGKRNERRRQQSRQRFLERDPTQVENRLRRFSKWCNGAPAWMRYGVLPILTPAMMLIGLPLFFTIMRPKIWFVVWACIVAVCVLVFATGLLAWSDLATHYGHIEAWHVLVAYAVCVGIGYLGLIEEAFRKRTASKPTDQSGTPHDDSDA